MGISRGWCVIVLLVAATAGADNDEPDYERSRALVQRGEILPLPQVLDRLQQRRRGRVLEVELEQEDGGYRYEIELLDDSGRVWEYRIDAASGEILDRAQEE
ncbi:MAG TPA: peptidase [Sedimenticola thiotaurini]|uniref:Peptidase n=1 Tax=Sedimenticola thiotaurini TaxID=1543721 RepID=A0A831RPR0_9GAMM|nr:peptidase [Sedimenticola thiotaurini]